MNQSLRLSFAWLLCGLSFLGNLPSVASAQERYPLTVKPNPADSRVRILNIQPLVELDSDVAILEPKPATMTVSEAEPLSINLPVKPELLRVAFVSRAEGATKQENETHVTDPILKRH